MHTIDETVLRSTVKDFLNAHRKGVFAIVDGDGSPTTSLMLYVIDDDMCVYFGTRKAFKKYGHMKERPMVALSVIEESSDPLRVVDIRGRVAELSPIEKDEAYHHFKSKNMSKYYVEGAEDYVMFKLTPTAIRWLDATSGELSITDLPIGT